LPKQRSCSPADATLAPRLAPTLTLTLTLTLAPTLTLALAPALTLTLTLALALTLPLALTLALTLALPLARSRTFALGSHAWKPLPPRNSNCLTAPSDALNTPFSASWPRVPLVWELQARTVKCLK
jgi:hypothetical protein